MTDPTPTTSPQPTLDELRKAWPSGDSGITCCKYAGKIHFGFYPLDCPLCAFRAALAHADALAREVADLHRTIDEQCAPLRAEVAELREVADAFRKTAAAEHDELERVLRKNAELRADKERLEAQLMAVDAAREKR